MGEAGGSTGLGFVVRKHASKGVVYGVGRHEELPAALH